MKTKLFTTLALIVFVVGLVGMRAKSASTTQQSPRSSEETERLLQGALPARAFTATQTETYVSAKGEQTVRHIRKTEIKADGSWTQVGRACGMSASSRRKLESSLCASRTIRLMAPRFV